MIKKEKKNERMHWTFIHNIGIGFDVHIRAYLNQTKN